MKKLNYFSFNLIFIIGCCRCIGKELKTITMLLPPLKLTNLLKLLGILALSVFYVLKETLGEKCAVVCMGVGVELCVWVGRGKLGWLPRFRENRNSFSPGDKELSLLRLALL